MRLRAALFVASIVLSLLLNVPGGMAQGGPGEMRVKSDVSITGATSLDGSGSVEVSFTGEAAESLRLLIMNKFDSGNQILDAEEVKEFMQGISYAIVGRIFWGMKIDTATDFSTKSDEYIVEHSEGLVSTNLASTSPISFTVGFEGSGSGSTKDILLAQGAFDTFGYAVSNASGYDYQGTFVVQAKATNYGFCSLTTPQVDAGKLTAVRFPWGEILWYNFRGVAGGGLVTSERITYESFSVMESQLIGFIVLFIGCLLILRFPGKRFDKYEKLHPRKFRKYAKPLLVVRLSAYILTAVLIILYLFPYLFSFVSPDALLYSAYLYFIVPAAVILEMFFSRIIYDKASLSIPEESVIEVKQAVVEPAEGEGEMLCKICYMPIEAGLDLFQCSCGLTMHVGCAEKAQNCPACGEPVVQLRTRSIQCRACGETFLYSGDEDAYSIQCSKCGAFQEDIKSGKNYLVVDSNPRNAFMMIRAMGLSNRPAMCLTTSFPGKVRSDYNLTDVAIKWFSDSTTDIDNLNPKDLEVDAMETVSTFLMTTKEAGVLVDGLETLIELNGFDKVLAFIKKINDLASTHGSTILLSLDKTKVTPEQYRAISAEFSEIHEYQ